MEMNDTVQFERALAAITIPNELRRNYSAIYRKMSLRELQSEITGIDWINYVKTLMSPIAIDQDELVIVYASNYFKNLSTLIERTSARTVHNYLLWRFVYNRVDNLDSRFLNYQQKFYKSLYGTQAVSTSLSYVAFVVNWLRHREHCDGRHALIT